MREIKFRVWNVKEKKMYPVFLIEWAGGGVSQENSFLKHVDPVNGKKIYVNPPYGQQNNAILMQYTGRKDKNGKEIYDGDIIQLLGHRPNIDCDIDVEEVIFEDGEFCHTYQDRPNKKFWEYATVIGNIYENPELINKLI
jgi:uncharacterized phage protein (TIGR01671 family)